MTGRRVQERPIAAFVLGLLGGIFILLGALVMSLFAFGALTMTGTGSMMGMMSGTMTGMYGGMGMGTMMGWSPLLAVVGLASGVLVIFGSVMFYSRPGEGQLWGAIVLVFSLISILGMGGFVVGLVLGVVAGALALAWKNGRTIV